jgi:hypothetical protein
MAEGGDTQDEEARRGDLADDVEGAAADVLAEEEHSDEAGDKRVGDRESGL